MWRHCIDSGFILQLLVAVKSLSLLEMDLWMEPAPPSFVRRVRPPYGNVQQVLHHFSWCPPQVLGPNLNIHPPHSTPSITLKHKLCVLWEVSRQSIALPARFFQLFAPFSIGCGKPFSWNLIDRPKHSRMQWGWPVYAEMLAEASSVRARTLESGGMLVPLTEIWPKLFPAESMASGHSDLIQSYWASTTMKSGCLQDQETYQIYASELHSSVSLMLFVSFRRALKLQHCRHSACFFPYISVWGDSTSAQALPTWSYLCWSCEAALIPAATKHRLWVHGC